ncbi:hypothetical protein [Ktedonobacter racemifer]|uniref:Uncharacterized protein n=1 Tax=Ktedonobacter racemifer DSM 44963 TaxID=485913 RepID=D6U8P6_KTERA|nr:hypothetical protein [Ktedonobacter racemifer]EFH79606.1 hypothetical protein Krac_0084 [Ktedonobacter racemifer DSM 44963]
MGIFLSREEVRQELEQVKVQFDARVAQMESTLLAEIRQTFAVEASVKDALLQHTHSVPRFPQEIYQTPVNVIHLQNRIESFSKQLAVLTDVAENLGQLTSQVEQMKQTVAQLSPIAPDGEPKPIHEVIGAHTQRISDAIGNIHTAHSLWLAERMGELEEAGRTTANLHELLNRSRQNISPKPNIVELVPEPAVPAQENHTSEVVE